MSSGDKRHGTDFPATFLAGKKTSLLPKPGLHTYLKSVRINKPGVNRKLYSYVKTRN